MRSLALLSVCCFICVDSRIGFGEEEDGPVFASIRFNELIGTPLVTAVLGTVGVGEKLDQTLLLRNDTSQVIEFDKVVTACSCTKLTPQRGRIVPGQELTVQFTMQLPDRAKTVESSGAVLFKHKDRQALRLDFVYSFNLHAGFASNVAIVEWRRSDPLQFAVPTTFGDLVKLGDVMIELRGIPGEAAFRISEDRRDLWTTVTLSKDAGELPYYGDLVIVNSETGEESHCRVVIEEKSEVKVFPSMLRARLDEDKGAYEGMIYVRTTDEQSRVISVTGRIGGEVFKIPEDGSVKLGAHVQRFRVSISSNEVDKLRDTNDVMNNIIEIAVALSTKNQKFDVSLRCILKR